MTTSEQDHILQALVARGWIDEAEIPPAGGDGAPLDRVDHLVRRGLLDAAVVRAIAEEIRGVGPSESDIPITEPPPRSPAQGDVPPELRRWDRYTVERLLGRGSSGAVYAARDPRLDRRVAIKILASGDDRAAREARLQARVAHDGVCEVYEVGRVLDRPFVAMRFVDGETLQAAARTMTREAIVIAARDACRAVHAAHRIGLVHRDLKPGNVMVERPPSGAARTFVVDFGLAREVGVAGSTVTGHVLGTPAFMAPEQARGDVRRIDRRTDVYGLGATLYAALSGTPPFRGDALAVLQAVTAEEAAPLRSRDASIPRDLETIAATCLEKDPARRYATAADLADDLDRYLAGEPIAARRTGVLGRAARWARAHRALAATASAGLAAAVVLAGGWARSSFQGREEAMVARRLGEEAKAMESALRIAYLAPLHDTRADRAAIEARFDAIRREAAARGPAARAAGAYAIGRGLLSLHRYDEAREHLEMAWNEGDRSPALSLSLARALGAIHDRELAGARRLTDPAARDARVKELTEALVKPALGYLAVARDGDGGGESKALVLGWIAFYEGRTDEALARAREALAEAPWLHEARKLEGDAHARRAEAAEDAGKLEDAVAIHALAAEAYERAGEIARSDAEVHSAACQAYLRILGVQVDQLLNEIDVPVFERGIDACERAIAADGGDPDPLEDEAHLLEIRGAAALEHGEDPRPWLAAGIARAEDVTLVFPDRAEAHATLGAGLWVMATYEARRGEDPRATLARGIDACERATELFPAHTQAHNYLGVMSMSLAEDAQRRGSDPRPSIEKAIAAYEASFALDPAFLGAWNNIGRARALAAEYEIEQGLSPRASLDAAHAAYSRALEVLSEHPAVHNNAGYAWILEARVARSSGVDPRPPLEKALAAFARTLSLAPTYSFAFKNTGDARRLAAELDLAAGRDPRPEIERAIASYDAALRSNPRYAGALRGKARALALAARVLANRGADRSREIASALAALSEAETIAPNDPDLPAARAEVAAANGE